MGFKGTTAFSVTDKAARVFFSNGQNMFGSVKWCRLTNWESEEMGGRGGGGREREGVAYFKIHMMLTQKGKWNTGGDRTKNGEMRWDPCNGAIVSGSGQ